MKRNKKSIVKCIFLLIMIIILILLINFSVNRFQKYRFKKILLKNDATNYELTEIVNGEETIVKVMDKILVSQEGEVVTWLDGIEKERVLLNLQYKTAIITKNYSELSVNSLNYNYINDYFENNTQKFKYLGKSDEFYKIQFTEKKLKSETVFFINVNTGIIEKIIRNSDGFDFITELKVKKNIVSKSDIAYPDISGYHVTESVSSESN